MATRKKNTSAAVAALVETATAKAAAVVAKAEETSVEVIRAATLDALHRAFEVETDGQRRADGIRREAFNSAIDASRKAGRDSGEIKDLMSDILDLAVEAGDLASTTAKAYRNGLAFAVERNVPWASDLHGTEARILALQAAGKAIPKALQAAAQKLEEKQAAQAARAAKHGAGHVASLDTIIKALAKALADARTIGRDTLAMDIIDIIHSIKPDFTEPRPE